MPSGRDLELRLDDRQTDPVRRQRRRGRSARARARWSRKSASMPRRSGAGVVCVCAKMEAEIAELDEEDRAEMLAEAGLEHPALSQIAREAYRTLGLQSYFTAGEKEVRAWTVPIGATAPQAAGVIHSDFERGFIRAEVYTLEDLETYRSRERDSPSG